ncbi:LysR family transcriptional regulator substrate-binding protein [Kitasatospora aburaviensis]
MVPWLRSGEVDLALGALPVDAPGLVTGPVLVREPRMLAVPADHPFARRGGGVTVDDLVGVPVVRLRGHIAAMPPGRADREPGTRGPGTREPGTREPSPGRRPTPSRRRSPWSEPGRASSPSVRTPVATTRART